MNEISFLFVGNVPLKMLGYIGKHRFSQTEWLLTYSGSKEGVGPRVKVGKPSSCLTGLVAGVQVPSGDTRLHAGCCPTAGVQRTRSRHWWRLNRVQTCLSRSVTIVIKSNLKIKDKYEQVIDSFLCSCRYLVWFGLQNLFVCTAIYIVN
jgi:hypothetical protein